MINDLSTDFIVLTVFYAKAISIEQNINLEIELT